MGTPYRQITAINKESWYFQNIFIFSRIKTLKQQSYQSQLGCNKFGINKLIFNSETCQKKH